MFRVAIILFPGTNCEGETKRSIDNAGLQGEYVRWNQREGLEKYDAYVLPGGFAYEDRSRAGIIAAKDPVMNIIKEQAALGKPVIGICNGCQVLVESGLVPGVTNNALAGAVAMNTRVKNGKIIGTGFYHDKVNIKSTAPQGRSAVTMDIGVGDIIPASVANGEGRFIFPTDLLLELERHNQIIFKYCTEAGVIENEFPTTPNGAMWGIAGLCNKEGNVVAYMPHPERFDTGIPLFASLKTYLEKKPTPESYELQWQPPQSAVEPYEPQGNVMQLAVDLIITDNEANTIELALTQQGYPVKVTRKTHWEIWHSVVAQPDIPALQTKVIQTGQLLNTNKETYTFDYKTTAGTVSFLVRYSDDYVGRSIAKTLQDKFQLPQIENIHKGTIWELHIDAPDEQKRLEVAAEILQTYILHNPYSQECKLIK